MSPGTLVVTLLVAGWLLQLGLAYRQSRVFMHDVGELRRRGTTAIGVSGKGWGRSRTFVALAAGGDGRVRGARELRGVTVWARSREVPGLQGRALRDLAAAPEGDGPAKATAMAARTLLEAAGKGVGEASP